MRTLACLTCVLVACVLFGCDTYRYNFDTVISEEGAVERTISFSCEPYHHRGVPVEEDGDEEGKNGATEDDRAEAPADNESDGALGFGPTFVRPDPARFVEFQLVENGMRGTWRSDGTIHSDVRWVKPSHTADWHGVRRPADSPETPHFLREAFNEGEVTLDDLVLVKTLAYRESFHDYYSGEEFEKYADAVIDICAAFMLDVLHRNLDEEYDLRRFDDFARGTCVPLMKRWKRLYLTEALRGEPPMYSPLRRDFSLPILAIEKAILKLELVRLGVIRHLRDFDYDYMERDELLRDWVLAKMHELVTRRSDGTPWPTSEITAYFLKDEHVGEAPPFEKSVLDLAAERYGDGDFFTSHLANLYWSFAFTSDHHSFHVKLRVPWPVIRARPRPHTHEPADNGTVVEWSFDVNDIFPDGVHLSLTCAEPAVDAQRRLFGRTAIETPDQMRSFIARVRELQDDEREVFLAALGECVESGTVQSLASAVHAQLPKEAPAESEALRALIRSLEALATSDEGR